MTELQFHRLRCNMIGTRQPMLDHLNRLYTRVTRLIQWGWIGLVVVGAFGIATALFGSRMVAVVDLVACVVIAYSLRLNYRTRAQNRETYRDLGGV